jgi:hypothetical protein
MAQNGKVGSLRILKKQGLKFFAERKGYVVQVLAILTIDEGIISEGKYLITKTGLSISHASHCKQNQRKKS